jgi:hypothetical protein
MATPTGLDLTMPLPGKAEVSSTLPSAARTELAEAPSEKSVAPVAVAEQEGSAKTSTSAIERTGTSVVLGRSHLITLAALVVVLIGGIGVLGYAAFKRRDAATQSASATPTPPAQESPSPAQQPPPPPTEPQPQAAQPDAASAAAAAATAPAAPPAASPTTTPTEPTRGAKPPTGTASGRGDAAAKKGKTPPKTVEAAPPPPVAEPVAPPTPEPAPPPPPPKPEVPAVTFKDVKVMVKQGNTLRDRDAVLTLAGDHLSVQDRSGKVEMVSLPYAAIQQAYFSRSKEPKWKGPDGKEQTADVDQGKMGFFRGDRNWLILSTGGEPVFLRLEDRDLKTILATIQERANVRIQR